MVTVENKFKDLPETEAYVGFGRIQVERINDQFDEWLAQQSFVDDAFPSRFEEMIVKGSSEQNLLGKKSQDNVEWDLRFAEKNKHKGLENALLHIKRYDNKPAFNSKPRIFSTADYFQITVKNGERGWVKTGEFPINVRSEPDYETINKRIPEQFIVGVNKMPDERKIPPIGIYTDIRRDAIAGFDDALQWQKFRAMAITCSGIVKKILGNESKQRIKKNEGKLNYNAHQHARSRNENVWPLFVQLLPYASLDNGPTALKQFYKPGALEGVLALELEHAISHNHGSRETGGYRPIQYARGRPIEISKTNSGYDALMKFKVQTTSYGLEEDEQIRTAIEEQLREHYTIEVKTPTKMEVAYVLKDAHKTEQAIREGNDDTELHKFARNFGDAIRYTTKALDSWREKEMPALEEKYKSTVTEARANHFLALESQLSGKK